MELMGPDGTMNPKEPHSQRQIEERGRRSHEDEWNQWMVMLSGN